MTAQLENIVVVEVQNAYLFGEALSPAELAELQTGWTFTKTISQPTSDAPTNTSRTTWVDAIYYSLVLPSGTWTVEAKGDLELVNYGAGPQADSRIMIAGNAGSTFARTVGGATPIRVAHPSHIRTGQSGTIGIRLQFKKSTAATGTLYAYAPALVIACKRTA